MNTLHTHACPLPEQSNRKGSALMVVLVVMILVSMAAVSLLNLSVHEKDLTYRRIADVEARLGLESTIEVGMADLQDYFRQAQSITQSTPSISLSSAMKNRITQNTRYLKDVRIASIDSRQFRKPIFVDSEDPDTLLDPHRGTHVRVSEWVITSEVDVDYRGRERKMQAQQSFQVRESPFFTHAILYNMDLEFHPGPAMDINGPVHSNGKIWAVAQNDIHFLDRVTATKGINMGAMLKGKQEDWSSGYLNNQSGSDVWFNANGRKPKGARTKTKTIGGETYVFANLYDGSGHTKKGASYYDARSVDSGKLQSGLDFTTMSEFLGSWFSGNVAMGSAEAPKIMPPSMPDYVADDGKGNRLNYGYSMIEPVQPSSSPLHKGDGERGKFAYKAGITFETRFVPDATAITPELHWRRLKDADGNDTDYWMIPKKIRRTNAFNMDTTSEGIDGVIEDPVFIKEEVFDEVFRAGIYDEDGNGRPLAGGGLYDKRDLKPQDLIVMDMGKFRTEIVETNDLERFKIPVDEDTSILTFMPSSHFNGVAYFEFPQAPTSRPDNISVARDNFRPFSTRKVDGKSVVSRNDHTSLSLFVQNAKQIPNPGYNQNRSPGFTLATNSRVYLHGSYNADGIKGTGSSSSADDEPSEHKVLAAIAADAITFLSDNFDVRQSKNHTRPSATFTEVNAALMAGILPTNSTDYDSRYSPREDYPISGGSHNYHRFLESFSGGVVFRYRGSLVAFFESELARSPQEQSNNTWYGAPNREYGFYDVFGTGAQPPGTPTARTYFKMDFRFL